jgi:hypothetical protein
MGQTVQKNMFKKIFLDRNWKKKSKSADNEFMCASSMLPLTYVTAELKKYSIFGVIGEACWQQKNAVF